MKNDLRIQLTKKMLKSGLLRCLNQNSLSKITVSDLCREAGINRATFYHHYNTPADVLRDIAEEYAEKLREIYALNKYEQRKDESAAVQACLEYLYTKKTDIKILFSKNAENSISGFGLNIVMNRLKEKGKMLQNGEPVSEEDAFLYSIITSSAVFGLVQVWLTMDIDKSPAEIMNILRTAFGGQLFSGGQNNG